MNERWRTGAGVLALLGSGLVFVSSVPAGWYGYERTDSYIFEPALGSPLWIERELMPLLALLGTLFLLVGIATLVYRDWGRGRALKWGGSLSILGGFSIMIGLYGPDLLGQEGVPVGPIPGLAGFVVAVWGGILLVIGGPMLAYAYIKAGRPRLGWTLIGFLPLTLLIGSFVPSWIGELAASLPILVLGGAIAWDLYFERSLSNAE